MVSARKQIGSHENSFSMKMYVVGTHWKRFWEALLIMTHNMLRDMENIKNFNIFG